MDLCVKCLLLSLFLVSSAGAQIDAPVQLTHAARPISAGQYFANLPAAPDQKTADGIVAALRAIPGIESASASAGYPILFLTVRSHSQVQIASLKQALKSVNPRLDLGTPEPTPATAENQLYHH